MAVNKKIRQFFFPSLTPIFLIRLVFVTLFAYLFFGHICTPFRIEGYSMEPTYHNGAINFCWKLRYLFSQPKRYDVVIVRLSGQRVMLLKRVVAVQGEQIAFRDGKIFVNSKEMNEPYLRYPCNWNLPPRKVEAGCLYVVGDNRSGPMENHHFGQTLIKRIMGVPLW